MTEFERNVRKSAADIQTRINRDFIQLCTNSTIRTEVIIGRSGSSAEVYLGAHSQSIALKHDVGHIMAKLSYGLIKGDCVNTAYCFKYNSDNERVNILVDGVVKKRGPLGFRFDKDIDNEGWGHPAQHIQQQFLSNPRFMHSTDDEFEAFSMFLNTIIQSYCKENSYIFARLTLSEAG